MEAALEVLLASMKMRLGIDGGFSLALPTVGFEEEDEGALDLYHWPIS
jgi:hypothetical protein